MDCQTFGVYNNQANLSRRKKITIYKYICGSVAANCVGENHVLFKRLEEICGSVAANCIGENRILFKRLEEIILSLVS